MLAMKHNCWSQQINKGVFSHLIFRDFLVLAQRYPNHYGIVLASQNSWSLSDLIAALDCMLTETQAVDLIGQVRWLNQWKR
ncbi:hypothetical protein FIS3754_44680 [Fischerella sp. NIES-3754]|nr:hypothetical protein FIS3754_44680 [Fischerella sp. NIES-3754]